MPACPPVAIVCFNRPELTRAVVDAVRVARPEHVYVIADAPRPHVPGEAQRCADVRAVFDTEIDWPCTVHRRFAEHNQGVEQSIERGLDWVFAEQDRAIVFEDDCHADPTFFDFCTELLQRYAEDDRVMMISGTRMGAGAEAFADDDYRFTAFSITWGWATWRRAWLRHRELFPRDWQADPSGAPYRTTPADPGGGGLVTRAGVRYFREVAASRGQEFGWDSHWFLTQVSLGTLAVAPAANLVRNAGFDQDATHTVSTRTMPEAEHVTFPLRHPGELAIDAQVERALELVLVRVNGRLARTVKRLVPHGRLREWGRALADRLVHSRPHRRSRSA